MAVLGWLPFLGIPKELWKRWQPRIVDHLDNALLRKITGFGRRYREFMLSNLRFIDLKGLATVGFYTPELDEVFVDVSLGYRAPNQIPGGLLTQTPAEITDRRCLNEFLDRPEPVILAMVGVPGSGKTTLLRHTARAVCRRPRGRRRRIPILLYLRDHIATIVADPHVNIPQLVVHTLGRMGTAEPPNWFEQHLRTGNCVVLLDGLDEVAKQEDRTKVATWVASQTKHYSRNDFVITSRPQGYRSAPIEGADVLQVRSFTDEQVTRFVHGWYLAIEQKATGETGPDIRVRAEEAADDLLKRLGANPALYDLTVNPLLLTMIANVHRFRGALPGGRADLYGEICQVMLSRRQEAKNLPIQLSGDRKESLLRTVAYTMMLRRVRDLSHAELHVLLAPALRRLSTSMSKKDLLADLSSNGLLIEREADLFSFAHLTFQEYLAATHIRDKGLVQVLAKSVDDIWWRETALLYATRADADPIVAACLSSGSATALALAFDVAEQDGDLAPDMRKQLDEILRSETNDPARLRLRTGVLIQRNLRTAIPTSAGGRLIARPVNTDVYELFMADTGTPAPDGPQAAPQATVTGMWKSDAAAFVRWVNEVTGGEPGYRLLDFKEAADPAVQRALGETSSVWVAPVDKPGRPTLFTPTEFDDVNVISGKLLAGHVRRDFECSTSTLARLILLSSLRTNPPLPRNTKRIVELLARPPGRHALVAEQRPMIDRIVDIDAALLVAIERYFELVRPNTFTTELVIDIYRHLDLDQVVEIHYTLGLWSAPIDDLGNTLPQILFETKLMRPTATEWPAMFTRKLLNHLEISDDSRWDVPLDALARISREDRNWFQIYPWTRRVHNRFQKIALPVLTRKQPVTAEIATAVRLAALFLAAEADSRGRMDVSSDCRLIAAGITLMELRAIGAAPVTETIMLTPA